MTHVDAVAAAQRAVHTAQALFEQAIRDEVGAGTPISDIAETLGDRRRRQRIYAILNRGEDGGEPKPPATQPVVYLRGRAQPQDVWERVERAMWARGWRTIRDRTQAFHLARGGSPVVLCDFTGDFDGLAVQWITVGLLRARYEDEVVGGRVSDLMTSTDAARYMRAGAEWIQEPVEIVTTRMELPLLNGGRVDRPTRADRTLDEQALALLVAQAFAG